MANTQYVSNFNSYFAPSEYNNQSSRKCTEKQIKYYNDLCKQKGVKPKKEKKVVEWSFEKMSEKIGELLGMQSTQSASGMTEKQMKTITDVLERSPDVNINKINPDWKKLDVAGASELIGKLFDVEREQRNLRPATDAQINKMIRMFLCPDVNFEDVGYEKQYTTYEGKKMYVIPTSNDLGHWVQTNVNQQAASDFIAKYRVEYMNWSRTRVSKEQSAMIRTLEERCANIRSAGSAHEQVTDINGDPIADTSVSKSEWCPVGYNKLTDLQLYLMSKKDASDYIDILQTTLADKEQIKFIPEEMKGDILESKRAGEGDTAVENDIDAMSNFIYGIFAQLGEDLMPEDEQVAQTRTDKLEYSDISYIRSLLARAMAFGVSFSVIDNLLDLVPNVREELYAK